MSTPAEVALPYGTLIGSPVQAPGGSSDALPQLTVVNYQTASAVLELQSTDGALLITRLTTAERNALNATQGMLIYNITTGYYEVFTQGDVWEALTQGSQGGMTPFYVTAGPVQMVTNATYYLNSGSAITLTLPTVANLDDTIIISTMNSNFTIAQNAGQRIRVFNALSTTGTGGSVTSASGTGCEIQISFNSQLWIASAGFIGTYNVT